MVNLACDLPNLAIPVGALVASMAVSLALLVLTCIPAAAKEQIRADFYVATNGNDNWSGRFPEPKPDGTDGPFATVARAQQAVRELRRSQPQRNAPVTVLIRGGVYYLPEPLVLTPMDSGTPASPTVYEAYPGEMPVLSGGRRLTGWRTTDKGWWEVHIPEVERGEWDFCQLWVNGERRYRPRLPKDSYYFIAAEAPPTEENRGKGYDRFVFEDGQIRADWHNLGDVDVLVFHMWTMSRLRIKSVDEATRTVTFTGPTVGEVWYADFAKGRRFIVENVREALERPGEWYLDKTTGVLTYIPMPGEKPETANVVAPRLERLLQLVGDGAAGLWVENVIFRGIVFEHCNWVEGPKGYAFAQAEAILPGAISATYARDCVFEDCAVRHVGAYAVEFGRGCKNCRLENCDLWDLGAGGVKIGEMGIRSDPNDVADHNVVRNCTIAHGGRLHPAGIGVWIGQSPDNLIEHNDIFDFYYSGMSIGWTWGYGPALAQRNVVQYNHIYQIGQRVLSDMGCIYTLGNHEGTVLRFNHMHDVDHYYYGGWGIYFDEGTTGILAEDNVVYRTNGGCFHQHYGRDNIVRNNIFAFDQSQQVARTRGEDHISFIFERNIVYWKDGVLLGGNFSGTGYRFDYNVYWNAAGDEITFAGMSLDEWRKNGQDVHSIIADPLFVDPEKGDFRLKTDSPAFRIGFEPIDISTAGRQTESRFGAVPPEVPRAYPPPPPPPPLADDFEDTPVGEKPQLAQVYEDDDVHVIRVTDETAASGKHCLKFIDGTAVPGREYNPHMFYQPGFKSGVLEGRFSIRLEPGAFAYHEWRHYPPGKNYVVGPALWFHPDGWLVANGKRLFQFPYGEWMHFRIVCGVGPDNTGTYELWVTLPGRAEPLHYDGLPCDRHFRSLDWYGFTANGNQDAVFYVDDIKLAPLEQR
ncbi:MAG: right-handed parallel beta-helix repeat-containing protein [Armatimonadetes bacterium]|nr:right-handed parallel beta-helix repeat-containing protein [Armatimonadota bacterium]